MTKVNLTKEYIVDYLKNYYNLNKDIPKSTDSSHPFCRKTVQNMFGSWNNALEIALIPKRRNLPKQVSCKRCNILFMKQIKEIKKSKNNFCSSKCSTIYNNEHRKTGNRISKLEMFLQKNLTGFYFEYNNRTICNGLELDIFIPTLNLAIEINGIVHYKPIYGNDKYNKIIEKDELKKNICYDKCIELIIIKDESLKFNTEYGEYILNIIYKSIHKQQYKNVLEKLVNNKVF